MIALQDALCNKFEVYNDHPTNNTMKLPKLAKIQSFVSH